MPEKETIMYEIACLLDDEVGEEKTLAFVEKLRAAITDKGGLIISEGAPKKQLLAYPIKEKNNALLIWVKFTAEPKFLKEIEGTLKKSPDVLRFLTIKKDKKEDIVKKPAFRPRAPQKTIIQTDEQKSREKQEKPEIKEEEIDKKLEELLGN